MTVIERAWRMLGEMNVMNDAQPYGQPATRFQDLLCSQSHFGQLNSRHCKRICELCGFVESCEDLSRGGRQDPIRNNSA